MKGAGERAVRGAAQAAAQPLKKKAPRTAAVKPATVKNQTAGRPAAAKAPASPNPVVQRLLGAVEREVGIAIGALKCVGSGLVRQAQSVVAPGPRPKPAQKKQPASAARGK